MSPPSKTLIPELPSIEGARVVIQGYGNVGSVAAKAFFDKGAVIIAVSDSQGGIYCDTGLDPYEIKSFKEEHETVVGMPNTMTMTNEEILQIECDLLIPAALSNQIHSDNAGQINSKVIVEAANSPITPKADEILNERGIHVLPDILVNAGGVTVSYFEWIQNQINQQWDLEEIDGRLQKTMYKAMDLVFSHWQKLEINGDIPSDKEIPESLMDQKPDFRSVALSIAIQRVADTTLMRGIWP